MPAGDAFTADQLREIDRAVQEAERISGREFSVHVGHVGDDSRRAAERLHSLLPHPDNSVLIQVDPVTRTLEIVTGTLVQQGLSNRQAALAAISMQTSFAAGDLARGLRAGLQQLAESTTPVASLHTDTP